MKLRSMKRQKLSTKLTSSHLDRTYLESDGVMDLLYSQENYFWQSLSGKSLTGKRGSIKITIGFALSYTRPEPANAGLYNELGYS